MARLKAFYKMLLLVETLCSILQKLEQTQLMLLLALRLESNLSDEN